MANSDNVIRAGLTPKLRDLPNLIAGLTYATSPASKHTVTPTPFRAPSDDRVSTLYDPPIPEFSVVQVKLQWEGVERHPAVDGPSIAVVTQGFGAVKWGGAEDWEELAIRAGDVFFIGAGMEVKFINWDEAGEFVMYRAFVEAGED